MKGERRGVAVDAPGFEPGASPLQGERSTADLRAPQGGRAMNARLFQLFEPATLWRRWTKVLASLRQRSPTGQCPAGQAQGFVV